MTQLQAVLFDLDGTLLDYDLVEDLMPHYFRGLTACCADLVPAERLLHALNQGTRAIAGHDGARTNEEAFEAVFYPLTGLTREQLYPRLETFYTEDFPDLRRYARPRPAAPHVIQTAFDLSYDVAIATNPYFPAIATRERLAWAGVADFPYHKVTTYENSHYVKPDLRYFQEILDELACPPEAALVIGDEGMDMIAARLGCQTYLVPGPATDRSEISPPPTYEGPLDEVASLLHWLRGN
jgi:FMN phosphatase YigB (HAD superfamily)